MGLSISGCGTQKLALSSESNTHVHLTDSILHMYKCIEVPNTFFLRTKVFFLFFSTTPIKYMEKDRVGDQTLCSAFSPGICPHYTCYVTPPVAMVTNTGGKYFATGGTDRIVRVYSCIPGPPTLTAEVSGHMVGIPCEWG